MRNPFKKSRGVVTANRNNVDAAHSRWGDRVGRPVNDSDRLVLLSVPSPIRLPDATEVRTEMCARIDAAAATGALDAGNFAFSDQWIRAQLEGWVAMLHDENRLRIDTAAQFVSGRTENLSVAWSTLLDYEERLATLDESIDGYIAQLRGEAPGETQRVRPTSADVQKRLHDLPSATQLLGLTGGEVPALAVPAEVPIAASVSISSPAITSPLTN